MNSKGFALQTSGDWDKGVLLLRSLSTDLSPTFNGQLYEDGELVLQRLKDHISAQDLGWTPLSPTTIELKGGGSTIYIETGTLFGALKVRRVKSSASGSTIIVGASPWQTHGPSGRRMSEIMGWMEYGTDKQPPRPLIRPTFEEMQDILKRHWQQIFIEEIHKYAR